VLLHSAAGDLRKDQGTEEVRFQIKPGNPKGLPGFLIDLGACAYVQNACDTEQAHTR